MVDLQTWSKVYLYKINMGLDNLQDASDIALCEISKYLQKSGKNDALKSIEEQMNFISTAAKSGVNPKYKLPNGRQFTFGTLSSRELSSPEELEIKKKIDVVTEQLSKV